MRSIVPTVIAIADKNWIIMVVNEKEFRRIQLKPRVSANAYAN